MSVQALSDKGLSSICYVYTYYCATPYAHFLQKDRDVDEFWLLTQLSDCGAEKGAQAHLTSLSCCKV